MTSSVVTHRLSGPLEFLRAALLIRLKIVNLDEKSVQIYYRWEIFVSSTSGHLLHR